MRLAALFTGGKDSTYAIHLAKKQGHEIACLITLKSKNPDSYMFHTPAIELTELQAEAMGLPLLTENTEGEKEKELIDLEKAIKKAKLLSENEKGLGKPKVSRKEQFRFEGLITGALFSEYQSSRIKKIAEKLNLKTISPLWHKPQEQLMQELIDSNFKFIFTAIAAEGLDKSWLNKIITQEDLNKLKQIPGINLAGEGGEFESLVIDCPLFKKKIIIKESEILEENKNTARLIIKKATLK
jgi:asparagine synthase (glutamine-hydrolysing)